MRYCIAGRDKPNPASSDPGVLQELCSAELPSSALGTSTSAFSSGFLRGAWAGEPARLGRSSSATACNVNLPCALLCFPSGDSLRLPQRLPSAGAASPQNPHPKLTLSFSATLHTLPKEEYHTLRRNRHNMKRHKVPRGRGGRTLQHRECGISRERLTPSWPACHSGGWADIHLTNKPASSPSTAQTALALSFLCGPWEGMSGRTIPVSLKGCSSCLCPGNHHQAMAGITSILAHGGILHTEKPSRIAPCGDGKRV